jgi:hypothetical protein
MGEQQLLLTANRLKRRSCAGRPSRAVVEERLSWILDKCRVSGFQVLPKREILPIRARYLLNGQYSCIYVV